VADQRENVSPAEIPRPGGAAESAIATGACQHPGMDLALPADLHALAAEAASVGAAAAATRDVPEDGWLVGESPAFALELAERGWLGMTWPAAEGGGGRSALERFVVYEQLIAAGAPLSTVWFADRQIGPTLLQYGTPEQRRRFLPGILGGTAKWCIGMSEPDAGSDVAGLRTTASPHGDPAAGGRWRVNGSKVWTSGAATADWCYLICRTDPDAPRHQGLSELVVDMHAPGVTVRPIQDLTGGHHFCEVLFEDVEVPGDLLVGQPNGAFKQIMRQMEHERGGIDRLVSNRRLYEDALALADITDPVVRQEIAHLEAGYRIGRLLVLREVLGQAPPGFSAVTKTFCTELEQRVASFCGRVAGADALLWGRVARNLCYAPGYTIMGGTTQILRNIIGERVLGLPR
jgi:alkylation response protein AidB-like acyl-CoA dehydrogenase